MYVYRYRVYIGYDSDNKEDIMLPSPTQTSFPSNITTDAQRIGINIQTVACKLDGIRTHHNHKKLGARHYATSAYNYLAAAAVADGAHFVYTVTQETEFLSVWPHSMTTALADLEPANVGVVMPVCPSCDKKRGQVSEMQRWHFVHR